MEDGRSPSNSAIFNDLKWPLTQI